MAEQLKPKQVASAMSRSINRTLTHERAVSKKLVRQRYNFPSDTVNNFGIHTANPTELTGHLLASSTAISLARFNPTFITGGYSATIKRTTKSGKNSNLIKSVKLRSSSRALKITGVTLTIIKGQKKTLGYAFITKDGRKPVFARGEYNKTKGFSFSKTRFPISPLRTASIYQAVAGVAVREDLNRDSLQFYQKTFEREINYQISKVTTNT